MYYGYSLDGFNQVANFVSISTPLSQTLAQYCMQLEKRRYVCLLHVCYSNRMWQWKKSKTTLVVFRSTNRRLVVLWRALEHRQQKIALFLYLSILEMRMPEYILLCSSTMVYAVKCNHCPRVERNIAWK